MKKSMLIAIAICLSSMNTIISKETLEATNALRAAFNKEGTQETFSTVFDSIFNKKENSATKTNVIIQPEVMPTMDAMQPLIAKATYASTFNNFFTNLQKGINAAHASIQNLIKNGKVDISTLTLDQRNALEKSFNTFVANLSNEFTIERKNEGKSANPYDMNLFFYARNIYYKVRSDAQEIEDTMKKTIMEHIQGHFAKIKNFFTRKPAPATK